MLTLSPKPIQVLRSTFSILALSWIVSRPASAHAEAEPRAIEIEKLQATLRKTLEDESVTIRALPLPPIPAANGTPSSLEFEVSLQKTFEESYIAQLETWTSAYLTRVTGQRSQVEVVGRSAIPHLNAQSRIDTKEAIGDALFASAVAFALSTVSILLRKVRSKLDKIQLKQKVSRRLANALLRSSETNIHRLPELESQVADLRARILVLEQANEVLKKLPEPVTTLSPSFELDHLHLHQANFQEPLQ